MGVSSAEREETAKQDDASFGLLSVRHLDPHEGDDSVPGSLDEVLEGHRRYDVKTVDAEVEEFERLDEDRRAEILQRIDETVSLERGEWMEPDREAATIEVDWEKLREVNPRNTEVYDDLEVKYVKPASLFRLSVRPEEDVNWQPGDFFTLKLPETPGIDTLGHQLPEVRKETAEDETGLRAYSAGSSPNSDTVDFYIKRIPNGEVKDDSLTPVLDAKVRETDTVKLRGPWSDELELKEISDRDMVYVATGTGVAPLKSMIDFTVEENLDMNGEKDIYLFLGASYLDELPGYEDFRRMHLENENFHFIPTLSREESLSDWRGETGYVQEVLEGYMDKELDIEEVEVAVCGLTPMAEGVRETLEDLGYDTDSGLYQEEVFD